MKTGLDVRMSEGTIVCPSIVDLLKRVDNMESKMEYIVERLSKIDHKVRNIQSVPVSIANKEDLEKPVRSIVSDVLEELQRMGEL